MFQVLLRDFTSRGDNSCLSPCRRGRGGHCLQEGLRCFVCIEAAWRGRGIMPLFFCPKVHRSWSKLLYWQKTSFGRIAPPILASALLCHFIFVEQIKFYTKNDVIMQCQEMILGKNLSWTSLYCISDYILILQSL